MPIIVFSSFLQIHAPKLVHNCCICFKPVRYLYPSIYPLTSTSTITMPPKKATGAAAQAKEAKEKKPAAAPAHGKSKGMFYVPQRDRIDAEGSLSLSRVNADYVCQI